MNYTIARKNSGAIVWSQDQMRYIIDNYTINDKTLKELSIEFGVQPQSIRNLLRKNNIEITNKKTRDFPRDSNYFEEINTPEKAYWLGMLFADGSIYHNSIALCLKDKEHVEKFRKALGAKNKITTVIDNRFSSPCYTYRFCIRDKKIASDLSKYNIVQNKSYLNLDFPNIPNEFVYDFIRGYFDGDGSIYWSNTNNKYIIDFCGQKAFLDKLKQILGKENLSLVQNTKSKQTYNLKIGGRQDVQRILSLLYADSTPAARLDRKYKLVQSCLSSGAYTLEPVKAGCE